MIEGLISIAFIGPGGPEFIVIMVVLLLMFGAKDAPRIFRKLNEMLNQVRNTADGFKREIMYGDLNHQSGSSEVDNTDYDEYDYDADYYDEGSDSEEDVEQDYSDETFDELEKDLEEGLKAEDAEPDAAAEPETEGEDGDVSKT